ncbi:MAG: class I SAM-dependent methyltransferase [Alphaproteobacteria bacterium]|nr:class I SAM-dependent methyltransferase [Alphaproteobacteria bacterium]
MVYTSLPATVRRGKPMLGPQSFNRLLPHGVSLAANHDEIAHENFAQAMHFQVFARLMPGNKDAYQARVLPAYVKTRGRRPKNRQEVRAEMRRDPYHQMWSALRRTTQELMWTAAQTGLDRDFAALQGRADKFLRDKRTTSTLQLDPALEMPRYITAVDIHCMPGGYTGEESATDVYAGAIYDRGVYSITQGFLGPRVDGIGRTIAAYIKRNFPRFDRGKILDIGCAIGHSTLPFCDAFPKAEIHAVDVSAPCLRYAFARAESWGKKVHFSQQHAEHLRFADNTFDFVTSGAVMHELSTSGLRNIVREALRVLKPGGVMIHVEQPQYHGMDPYDQFMRDWDTFGNNEPFWGTLHDLDLTEIAVDAGFKRGGVGETMEMGDGGRVYNVDKPDAKTKANWFFYTARK